MYQVPNYFNPFITRNTPRFNSAQDIIDEYNSRVDNADKAQADKLIRQLGETKEQQLPVQAASSRGVREASIFPFVNAALDVQEIGTGLSYLGTHMPEVLGSAGDYLKRTFGAENYYTNNGNLLKMGLTPVRDLHDFALANYDIKAGDYADVLSGKQTVGQIVGRGLYNAYKSPVSTLLDLASFGVLGKASNAAKAVTKAGKVEDAISIASKNVRAKGQKFIDTAEEFQKVGSDTDRLAAIEALERGIELPQGKAKEATKVLSKMTDTYSEMVPDYARVNNFELAHNTRRVREGKVPTVAEADAELDRFRKGYEVLDAEEGLNQLERGARPSSTLDWEEIKKAAESGDDLASDLVKSKELYDKKYLKPVPHGMAEVTKDIENLEAFNKLNRVYAGKYSTRAYGNASYSDILKQLEKPELWADSQMKAFVEGTIAEEIAKNGTMGGVPIIGETVDSKNIRYLDRELLEQGKLTEAMARAIDNSPKSPADIPIDKNILNELKNQLATTNDTKPFGNTFANELWQMNKGNILSTGSYLAGNFYTGAFNALMNAGLNPIGMVQDFAESVATKGKLIKGLGLYRSPKPTPSRMETPLFKAVDTYANKPINNILQAMDARIQNLFAEMATHRNLRSQGIGLSDRLKAIQNMEATKVAEAIRDVRLTALLNPPKTMLPRYFQGAMGMFNPFWRWIDTAAQSTGYMFKKHPIVSDIVFNKVTGNIAFDKEMQNRLNLNVSSDKPFVSYRYNPYTQQVEETTSEFAPAMNTLRFIGETARAVDKGDIKELPITLTPEGLSFWNAVISSVQGLNRYGKPIRRPEMDRRSLNKNALEIINGSRMKFENGQWVNVGGQADEILGTTVQEMLAPVRLLNKTILPAAAGAYNFMTGNNIRYYQPYQNQIFGEFNQGGQMPEYANPRSSKAGLETINNLLGIYARPYDESYEQSRGRVTPSSFLRARRSDARYDARTQTILNRYK